jgi:hypothetical protein
MVLRHWWQSQAFRALIMLIGICSLDAPIGAQDAVALAIEGWAQSTGADGVVSYRCSSKLCAAGAVVSYKPQPHRAALTLAEFEEHHRRLAEHYKGSGRIRDVRISAPRERTVEGIRVLQIEREVEWDDHTTFSVEARLIGPDKSFSLVSDSAKPEWTAKNYEGFLLPLADIAGIKNGP